MGDFDRCMRCGRYLPSTTNVGAPVCGACAATPPEPAALTIVHDNDGKGRPVCGAVMNRGDSVWRSGVTCRACREDAPAPEPDEAERESSRWNSSRILPGNAREVASLTTLLRAAEARGRDAGLSEALAAARVCGGPCRRRIRAALRGEP